MTTRRIDPTTWHKMRGPGCCLVCDAPPAIAMHHHRAVDSRSEGHSLWIIRERMGQQTVCDRTFRTSRRDATPIEIDPTSWHRKPHGKHGSRCPTCGAPGRVRTNHRLLPGAEGSSPQWAFLDSQCGQILEVVTGLRQGQHPNRGYHVDTSKRRMITPRVRELIIAATRLLARGLSWKEAAAELGCCEKKLFDYHERHRKLWDFAFTEASKEAGQVLRAMAGSPDLLRNGGKLIRVATAAAEQQGEPLFAPDPAGNGKQTLPEFLEAVYIPGRIEITCEYAAQLRRRVSQFCAFMGKEPTLDSLNEADLCRFLSAFRKSGRSGVTTNKARQLFLTVWSNAWDNGLCARPPRLKLIRRVAEEVNPPEAWTVDQVNRLLSTAATWPGSVGEVPARAWWFSLLSVAYWTSCRIGSLLAVPCSSWEDGGLLVRKQKNHRPQWYSLPPSCCAAILETKPATRNLLWPWPKHPRAVWIEMRRIVETAGLPCPRTGRQLFHRLRRTTLSLCAAVDPAIAQRQAGHADYATTLRHYIDPRVSRGRSAADVLPEPIISHVGEAM